MKPVQNFFALSATALLAGLFSIASAQADTTLVYGEVGEQADAESGETKEGVLSAQRIYIQDGMLALETFGESRVVLFDQKAGTVKLIDHEKKAYLDLDLVLVSKMAERLTETQRQVLNGLEKKLAEMPKKEREEMRQLLDDLHKATDLQLSETPKIRYLEGPAAVAIDQFETSTVDAFQNEKLAARYYLVDYKTLGMTEAEYQTLVEFQGFVRRLSDQTPGVMRRHFGDFEMLAESDRVPVQVIRFNPEAKPEKQKLLKHFNREIESDWFKIPEGYQFKSLIQALTPPGTGA